MTLKRAGVRDYLSGLRAISILPGSTEPTYRQPLVDFLHRAARELGFGEVQVHGELRLADVGQPDLQVLNSDGTPIGYGETKAIGTASAFTRAVESGQVERYRTSLDNLLVTDFVRFTLFRTDIGRLDVTLVETPGRLTAGDHAVSQPVLGQLGRMLAAFFSATAPVATSVEQLADGLARRTTLLREAIRTLLQPEQSAGEALRRLWEFYRRSLMSDMDADDFADTYAQTLIYALFLTRLEHGPIKDLDKAWSAIPTDVPILKSAIEPLKAAGRLPDAMSVWLTDALHLLASTPESIVATIGHPTAGSPDPILYFYEHFLAAYDRIQRIRRGVYYTPRPLVEFIVRAVNDTLKSTFGRPLGLADKDVRLLDPALGTGTFLLAAAQAAVSEVTETLGSGAAKTVLEDHVLRDFYGFELLPAPYTISHVKLALLARDAKATFAEGRAPVYLTNTLGDPVQRADDGGLLAFFVPGLIDEAAAAERVKSDVPLLVIIGNPPWSATSHNKQPEIERLFAAWKTVDGRPGSALIRDARMALNDDYLKFLRWAVWKVVEQPNGARHGIVAFVTNHAFLNNRVHRGVRRALLDAFDDIVVFNLQGNQRMWVRGVIDDKVFPDVQQGVALTVLVRRDVERTGRTKVRYRETRGTREEKYAAASAISLGSAGWVEVTPSAPFWSFAPRDDDYAEAYESWPSVREIFPVGVSGIQTQRDDLISDVDRERLLARIRELVDTSVPAEQVVARLNVPQNSAWSLADDRKKFAPYAERRVVPWLYRLFDRRLLYWDPAMMGRARESVMRHLLPRPFGVGGERNLALAVQRARPIATIATMARGPIAAHVTGHWCHVYPLRLSDVLAEDGVLPLAGEWRENLDHSVADRIRDNIGRRPSVDEVAWYALALLSAPSYRARFKAALSIDHPRIPIPVDPVSFERLVGLGSQLASAHLLEAEVVSAIRFEGDGSGIIERVRYDRDSESAWINRSQAFTGVSAEAWAWGQGFRPLEHFLTDREGRRLDAGQVAGFQAAIQAVTDCLRLEPALDSALDELLRAEHR